MMQQVTGTLMERVTFQRKTKWYLCHRGSCVLVLFHFPFSSFIVEIYSPASGVCVSVCIQCIHRKYAENVKVQMRDKTIARVRHMCLSCTKMSYITLIMALL